MSAVFCQKLGSLCDFHMAIPKSNLQGFICINNFCYYRYAEVVYTNDFRE